MLWKLIRKLCTFGSKGLRSHSEETKKARFLEFLVSRKKFSKSSEVLPLNKTSFSSTSRDTFAAEIRVAVGDITFVH
jgi:hypothetical protein